MRNLEELAIIADNGQYRGTATVYFGRGDVGLMANALRGFPKSISQREIFSGGSEDSDNSFAKDVDRQIEALTQHDYLRQCGRGKLLREELYPISRLALHLKQPGLEVHVEAFEDNRPADGHIRESGFRDREFDVQVTSDYSYDDALRDELLAAEGMSWGDGDIDRDKSSGMVIASPGVVDHDEHFKRVSESIIHLFRKKTAIAYGPNTVLIVSFDDIYSIRPLCLEESDVVC
jgi:hypothetical protein